MGIVIVEQFNPVHGYWNKLYEVDSADFDPDAPITIDKYGGPYRNNFVAEKVVVEDPAPEVAVEDIVPDFIREKLEEKVEVVFEEEELEEEDPPKYDDSRW